MTVELAWLASAGPPRLLAELVATVDLERALADFGADAPNVRNAQPDTLLGARTVVVETAGATVVIAEPSTEGRLAATLARSGEGIAGRYVAAPVDLDAVRRLAAVADVTLSRPATGPFGLEVLVLTGAPAGPHVLVVDPRTLPSPG